MSAWPGLVIGACRRPVEAQLAADRRIGCAVIILDASLISVSWSVGDEVAGYVLYIWRVPTDISIAGWRRARRG